ncbi:hydride transferase 1 [Streptomyces sp. SPB78]|uniref:TIGR03619 family F420-dependent LLM class oxidoreductase n=1 Tax=Streptomyces sp. (strain SPB78) TaxID=591157 RepID=UPI0001B54A0C|nr:TIGR03619 family F420-dependent LLM class oxidoreductase [Streptomyces sp. SPB78]EFL04283.1 hydride transferase 1 [Streptomyces sp. SPB78]
MDMGIALPQYGTHARPEVISAFARDAEDAGFDSLWVGDRSLAPVSPSDLYPGHTPDVPYPPQYKTFLDPLVVLTLAAASTHRARLGTSTLNAPWYPALLLARSLTSLDLASGGRLDPGLGIGWLRDEYTAVNADFDKRGALLEEILDVLDAYWTQEEFAHEGTHWTIPRSYVGLRPAAPGGPPVYLGGFSPAAMRRIGRRAAGWVGTVLPEPAYTALWDTARRAADEADRDPGALRRLIRYNPAPGVGVPEIADTLLGMRELGAEGCFVDLQQSTREPKEALDLGIQVLERVQAR